MGETILLRLEGESSDFMPDADQFDGWPPPEQLVLGEWWSGASIVTGFVTGDQPLPIGVRELKRWQKISQSEITDDQIVTMTHVVRGAEYKLESEAPEPTPEQRREHGLEQSLADEAREAQGEKPTESEFPTAPENCNRLLTREEIEAE